jgi:hypothetical protein
MKSIRLNIRALVLDGNTSLPSGFRISYDSKADTHELAGSGGGPLGKFGVLHMRDLIAHEVISASDHAYVSRVGYSGQAGSFVVRSCHVGFGRQIATSPTRETDPSSGASQVGPFALGSTDDLVLLSNAGGEQAVTLALLIGTAIEVERLLDRNSQPEPESGDPAAPHAETHQSEGADPLDVTDLPGVLAEPQLPMSHASSHESEGADELDVTDLPGVLAEPQIPMSHASDHASAGSDPIKLDDLATPDDNADLNATTNEHGLLRKLSGSSSDFLTGAGTWVSTGGADSTAIHDNVAGEIAAVTSKATPGPSDLLLIEDDADSDNKKRVTIGSLRFGEPTTVYELDWSAQSSQLGITSGTVVVDGKNWTAVNSGYTSTFQILNGSGLQMTASSGTGRTFDNGLDIISSTAPGFYAYLEDLAAECARYDLPLTIWSYFSAWSVPNTTNSVFAGVGGTGTPYTGITSGVGFRNASGTTGAYIKRSSTESLAAVPDNTHKVVMWHSIMDGMVEVYSGTWSSGWPARDDLVMVGRDIVTGSITTSIMRRSSSGLIYSPQTRSSSGAPSFTLARTRIQIG